MEVDVYYHLFMVIITIVTLVYLGNKTTYNTWQLAGSKNLTWQLEIWSSMPSLCPKCTLSRCSDHRNAKIPSEVFWPVRIGIQDSHPIVTLKPPLKSPLNHHLLMEKPSEVEQAPVRSFGAVAEPASRQVATVMGSVATGMWRLRGCQTCTSNIPYNPPKKQIEPSKFVLLYHYFSRSLRTSIFAAYTALFKQHSTTLVDD